LKKIGMSVKKGKEKPYKINGIHGEEITRSY
jgi:hypothetical protein